MRVRTQDDFIKKAIDVHKNKYDYSKVIYVNTSTKVDIICPIHGMFKQTPHSHLSGKGCKLCGRESTKIGNDEFIRRARQIHGLKYDYSKVDYHRKDKKVIIICPVHGEFRQTPNGHLYLKQGCPKCSSIEGGKKRSGENHPMKKTSVKEKVKNTCIERYGTKTYAESLVGRKKLHDIICSDEVQQKSRNTCMMRYGASTWSKSIDGKRRLHEIMSTEQMLHKIEMGYLLNYGVTHYMKTDEGRERARQNMLSVDRQIALKNGFLKKYGVTNAFLVPEIQRKIELVKLEKYGTKYPIQVQSIQNKVYMTKRQNHTFGTSIPEQELYELLCFVFGKENIIRQYNFDIRYPFACDFYIKTIDLFIELNAHWTHGGHWFDIHDLRDINKLLDWQYKSITSDYYKSAIYIWTQRDLLKRQIAVDNNLNYVVFWDANLNDAKNWLNESFII